MKSTNQTPIIVATRRHRIAFYCKLAHNAHGAVRAILLDLARSEASEIRKCSYLTLG